MAKVTITKTVSFLLELNENESGYLLNVTQNYLGAGVERREDKIARESIFTAIYNGHKEACTGQQAQEETYG